MTLIQAQGLTVSYRGHTVLRDVDFAIEPGKL